MIINDHLAKKFIRTFWGPDAFNGRLQHGLSLSAPLYGDISGNIRAHADFPHSCAFHYETYGLNASITAAGRTVAPLLGAAFAMWLGMRSVFVLAAAVYGLAALVVLHIRRTENLEVPS